MTQKPISIELQLTILKPVARVFAAVLKPVPFFVESASAPMKTGLTVQWKFPEMPILVPVMVKKVVANRLIRFTWDSGFGRQNTCTFQFAKPRVHNPAAPAKPDATTITVTESGWPKTAKGRRSSYRNLMGWTHMLCALKAHLEHGVNLRTGAFLHYKF